MSQVRRIFGIIVVSLIAVVNANATIEPIAPSVDGNGCYLIGTSAELYGFSAITNGTMTAVAGAASPYCVKLTDDITVNAGVLNETFYLAGSSFESWTPINTFTGTFDGQGHVISGLFVERENNSNSANQSLGLFKAVSGTVTIKNLGIEDSYFVGYQRVGAFVGDVYSGATLSFLNCYSRSNVTVYNYYAGGFVGYGNGTINVTNSYVVGRVGSSKGTSYYGPFFGKNPSTMNFLASYYYLSVSSGITNTGASSTYVTKLSDGTIARVLFKAAGGQIWRQGEDEAYPSFRGNTVKGMELCNLHYSANRVDLVECNSQGLPKVVEGDSLLENWYASEDFSGSPLESFDPNGATGVTLYAKWTPLVQPQVDGDGCYLIGSTVDLYSFARIVNGLMDGASGAASPYCAKLTADIKVNKNVLSSSTTVNAADSANFADWTPMNGFTGTFDGQGHVISGLYVYTPTSGNAGRQKGLFGLVGGNTTIKNLGIEDSYFYGSQYVGAFVGYENYATTLTFQNCYSRSLVWGSDSFIGGFVGGRFDTGTINMFNSYVTGYTGKSSNTYSYGVFFGMETSSSDKIENSYYLSSLTANNKSGTPKDLAQFNNGDVAVSLHAGNEGEVWKQGLDAGYPNFKDDVVKGLCYLNYYDGLKKAYNCGSLILPRANRAGYQFKGWYSNENLTGDVVTTLSEVPVDEPSFYAKWSELPAIQTDDGCYQITSASDLYHFASIVNENADDATGTHSPYCAKLMADIVVNENVLNNAGDNVNATDSANFDDWTPINNFSGTFDGQGHVISGLYFYGSENNAFNKNIALFANVSGTAEIKNLGIEDSYFYGYENVASFVGSTDANANLSFLNVYSRSYVKNNSSCVAGFVGSANQSTIGLVNSYSAAELHNGVDYSSNNDMFFCSSPSVKARNSYYLKTNTTSSRWGMNASIDNFNNGDIVKNLFSATDGHIWRQGALDVFPSFTGDVVKNVDICYLRYSDDLIENVNCAAELPMGVRGNSMVTGWCLYSGCKDEEVLTGTEIPKPGTTLYPKMVALAEPTKVNGCYQLGSVVDLYSFASIVNGTFASGRAAELTACAELTADITVNSGVLSATATSLNKGSYIPWVPMNSFAGSIDGKGNVISGLYVDDAMADNVGFIRSATGTVKIKNIGIEDSYFFGYNNVGAFIGDASSVMKLSFLNSYSRSYVLADNYYAGGFAGMTSAASTYLDNCYVVGYVKANGYSSYSGAFFGVSVNSDNIYNSYYLSGVGYKGAGSVMYEANFTNGRVAAKLRGGENGEIWSQDEEDSYPNFKGEGVKNACYLHHDEDSVQIFDCVALSSSYKLPEPTRTGYLFEGWFATEDFSGGAVKTSDNSLRGDLYAKWKKLVAPQKVNGCYQIGTLAELYGFASVVNGTFESGRPAESGACGELTQNITINSNVVYDDVYYYLNNGSYLPWTPIGTNSNTPFSGNFDGKGHTISGLYFKDTSVEYVGLFGYVSGTVEIKNLGIEDSYFEGGSYVGSFVGYKDGGEISFSNCYARSRVYAGQGSSSKAGGFIGYIGSSWYAYATLNIDNCYMAGRVHYYYSSSNSGVFFGGYDSGSQNVSHSYYLSSMDANIKRGTAMTADQFSSGEVVDSLFSGTNGTIWRQGESDAYPSFNGDEVKNVAICYLHYGDKTDLMKCSDRVLPGASRNGYLLDGWYANAEFEGGPVKEIPEDVVSKTSYYAKWNQLKEPQVVDGCYQISSAVDLYSFAAIVNGTLAENRAAEPAACGKLTADIVVNSDVWNDNKLSDKYNGFISWTPIGDYEHPFNGSFDGDYHTISGLYVNDANANFAGLFGYVAGDNTVRIADIGIADAYLRGDYVGGLVACTNNAKLNFENVYVRGYFSGSSVGGFVALVSGSNSDVKIFNSYAWGTFGAYEYNHGGLLGYVNGFVKVENSYYLDAMGGYYGRSVEEGLFTDGTVATLLHNGENGSRWGQNTSVITGSNYPDFSGNVISSLKPLTVTLYYGEGDERTFEYFADFRELPTPTREEKTFLGWYLNADFSGERIASIPSEVISGTVIYAKWINAVDGCIQIASASDLYDFATLVNGAEGLATNPYACGKLVDNITVNSNVLNATGDGVNAADSANFKKWTPIGTWDNPFKGAFDGQGYTISGLYFNNSSVDKVGLFGYVSVAQNDTVRIKNVGIENSYLQGNYIGAIAGYIESYNSENKGVLEITGVHSDGVFGNEESSYYVGGLVGFVYGMNINLSNSYSLASVGGKYVGGLVGETGNTSLNVLNSYSRAVITSHYKAGGLVGEISSSNKLNVINSYSAAEFNITNGDVGALAGYDTTYSRAETYIENFFYVADIDASNKIMKLGDAVTVELFNSGVVAGLLHSYTANGSNVGAVWGQKNEEGSYPELNVALEKIAVSRTVVLHSLGQNIPYPFYDSFSKKLPTYSQDGYLFLGWFADEDYSGERLEELPDGATDLYAKWIVPTMPQVVDHCYEIGTVDELYGFAAIMNGKMSPSPYVSKDATCAKLTADITVNSKVLKADGTLSEKAANFVPWTPIGTGYIPFTFDGDGHTISGLYTDLEDARVGFIGLISNVNSASVKNIGIVDSYFKGSNSGALIGFIEKSKVTVENAYNASMVNGSNGVGGLVGYVAESSSLNINKSYNSGTITSTTMSYAAGLVGYVYYANTRLENVYNVGSIYGSYYAGGFIGRIDGNSSQSVSMSNGYSAGDVWEGNEKSKAFVGYLDFESVDVENCYYLDGLQGDRGTEVCLADFANGNVVRSLRSYSNNGVDGSIWGQNITDGEKYPNFSGEVIGGPTEKTVVLHYAGEEKEYKYLEGLGQLPVLPEGYVLAGWYLNAGFSGNPIAEIPENVTDIYANAFKVTEPGKDDKNCYLIGSAGELYGFAAIVNGTFAENRPAESKACGKLTANITVNKNVLNADGSLSANEANFAKWTPIGKYDIENDEMYPFSGSFDGQGHTISGLYVSDANQGFVGLFGLVYGEEKVSIKNLKLSDVYISTGASSMMYEGGLIGYAYESQIEIVNVGVENAVIGGSSGEIDAGGLIGYAKNSRINLLNVYSCANVTGFIAGGLVGYAEYGKMQLLNAYSGAAVTGQRAAGAVVGYAEDAYVTVSNTFYLDNVHLTDVSEGMITRYGTSMTEEQFAKGLVVTYLRNDENGSIWGQNITDGEKYPNFSGEVIGGPAEKTIVLHYGDKTEEYKYLEGLGQLPVLLEGYVAVGWYLNAEFSGSPITEIPGNATDIYANVFKVTKPAQDAENCYLIGSAGELYGFAAIVNGTSYYDGSNLVKNDAVADVCGKLTANITVNKNVLDAEDKLNGNVTSFAKWTPIGKYDIENDEMYPFSGSFDGQGHVVSGLVAEKEDFMTLVGLFGMVASMGESVATIRNVGVTDSYFHGKGQLGAYVGGVVGVAMGADLSNVFSRSVLSAEGEMYVGGLVGSCVGGSVNIYNSYSVASLPESGFVDALIYPYPSSVNINVVNSYYLEGQSSFGTLMTEEQFTNGTVAILLHNGENGSVWGQNVTGGEKYPNFSGEVIGGPAEKMVVLHYAGEEKEYKYLEGLGRLPVLPEGYVAVGWYLNAEFSGSPITEIPGNATDIYANAIKVTKPQFADNCYAISNAGELYGFAAIVNGTSYYDGSNLVKNAAVADVCGKLTANIIVNKNVLDAEDKLNGNVTSFAKWTPIGKYDIENDEMYPFSGSFDGQGHTISGLVADYKGGMMLIGLFGYAMGNSEETISIRNVGVVDSYFHGITESGAYVGGIIGAAMYVNLSNVFSRGSFSAEGRVYVGGLIGAQVNGRVNIYNSYSVASLPESGFVDALIYPYSSSVNISVVNSYYLEGQSSSFGTAKSATDFSDGTVAGLLHHTCADGEENCVDGSIWGQRIGVDAYPNFSGVVIESEVVLDWNSASDKVVLTDSNFVSSAKIRIADGKQFYANGKIYESGDYLTSEQIAEIGSNTLYPISGVELETDSEGKLVASLNADSEKSLVIATDITVDKVVYKREMKAGIYQTVMLPFNVANLKLDAYSNYGFYRFTSMDENVDGYRYMAMVYRVRLLQANMPYIMKNIGDTDSDGIVFEGEDRITLNTVSSGSREFSATSDDGITWSMKGVYENKVWKTGDSEIGSAYLFAGQEKDGYKIGEFAKLGAGASLQPMRMYLLKDVLAQLSRPGMFGSVNHYGSSESIGVRFVDDEEFDEGEETMVEKRITVIPTVIKSNRWYDMKGRAIDSKPTVKGIYYHNGKRIIIK